jgi:hypothetical protein
MTLSENLLYSVAKQESLGLFLRYNFTFIPIKFHPVKGSLSNCFQILILSSNVFTIHSSLRSFAKSDKYTFHVFVTSLVHEFNKM